MSQRIPWEYPSTPPHDSPSQQPSSPHASNSSVRQNLANTFIYEQFNVLWRFVEGMKEDMDGLRTGFEQFRGEVGQKELRWYQEDSKRYEERVRMLETENLNAKATIEELHAIVETERREKREWRTLYEEYGQMATQHKDMQANLKAVQERALELQAQIDSQNEENEKLKTEVERQAQELRDKDQLLKQREGQLRQAKRQMDNAKTELETVRGDREKAEGQMNELRTENAELRIELQNSKTEKKLLQKHLSEVEATQRAQQQQVERLRKELAEERQRRFKMRAEVSELRLSSSAKKEKEEECRQQ